MEWIKQSQNIEFDVIYADGTRNHACEGILFEAVDDRMVLHLGTNRIEVLFAVAECLTETIAAAGLGDLFRRYIENGMDEGEAVDDDA